MAEALALTAKLLVTVVTPAMTPDWHVFALEVVCVNFEENRWAVTRHHQYLDEDGDYSWRSMDDDAWREAHVFAYEEALVLARKYAGDINVNGHIAQRVADQWHAEGGKHWRERADAG